MKHLRYKNELHKMLIYNMSYSSRSYSKIKKNLHTCCTNVISFNPHPAYKVDAITIFTSTLKMKTTKTWGYWDTSVSSQIAAEAEAEARESGFGVHALLFYNVF